MVEREAGVSGEGTARTIRHAWQPHPLPSLKPRSDGARWWRSVEYDDGSRGRQVSVDQETWKDEVIIPVRKADGHG